MDVPSGFAKNGDAIGGGATLMLAEVSPSLYAQLVKTGTIESCGVERVFIEETDVFAATRRALQAAQSLPPI